MICLNDLNFRINYLPNQDLRIDYLPNQDPWKQYAVEELYDINAQRIGTETGQRIDCRGCIKGVVNFSRLLDKVDIEIKMSN